MQQLPPRLLPACKWREEGASLGCMWLKRTRKKGKSQWRRLHPLKKCDKILGSTNCLIARLPVGELRGIGEATSCSTTPPPITYLRDPAQNEKGRAKDLPKGVRVGVMGLSRGMSVVYSKILEAAPSTTKYNLRFVYSSKQLKFTKSLKVGKPPTPEAL
eukprot:890839-Pelagomonas_calceolata.AAC.1